MRIVISTGVRNERSGEIFLLPSFRKEGLREVLPALTRAMRLDVCDGLGFRLRVLPREEALSPNPIPIGIGKGSQN